MDCCRFVMDRSSRRPAERVGVVTDRGPARLAASSSTGRIDNCYRSVVARRGKPSENAPASGFSMRASRRCYAHGTDEVRGTRPGCAPCRDRRQPAGAQTLGRHLIRRWHDPERPGCSSASSRPAQAAHGHHKASTDGAALDRVASGSTFARGEGPVDRPVCVLDAGRELRLSTMTARPPRGRSLASGQGAARVRRAVAAAPCAPRPCAPAGGRHRPASSRPNSKRLQASRPRPPMALHAHTVELAPTGREHAPRRRCAFRACPSRTPAGAAPIRGCCSPPWPWTRPRCRRSSTTPGARIEDWRRILKSGCKVEELANRTAARLIRAAAVESWFAWRASS